MTHFSRRPTRTTARLTRSLAIGAAIALLAGACAVAAPPSGKAMQLNGTRNAALWPFSSTSPWNMPIGIGAQFTGANDARNAELRSAGSAVNAGVWSHPVYQARTTDPMRSVSGGSGNASYRIPNGAEAALPNGGDMHMHVVDPTQHYVDEAWDMTPAGNGNWDTPYHVRTNLYGPGVGEGGVRAYGGSALGGLIRVWEIQAGSIRHALAFGLPPDLMAHGPLWPATTEDGWTAYGGDVHMGSLFAIPGSVNVNALGLNAQGLVLAHALQDYGAYLVDASGNFSLFAETAAEGTIDGMRNDVGTLQNQLRFVTNNRPGSVGGGGAPRVPLAPPIG
jgi:hypothetical protein